MNDENPSKTIHHRRFLAHASKSISCTWHIKTLQNKRVFIQILEDTNIPCRLSQTCAKDWLEVKLEGAIESGQKFCCLNGSTKRILSPENEAFILLRSYSKPSSLEVKFKVSML